MARGRPDFFQDGEPAINLLLGQPALEGGVRFDHRFREFIDGNDQIISDALYVGRGDLYWAIPEGDVLEHQPADDQAEPYYSSESGPEPAQSWFKVFLHGYAGNRPADCCQVG